MSDRGWILSALGLCASVMIGFSAWWFWPEPKPQPPQPVPTAVAKASPAQNPQRQSPVATISPTPPQTPPPAPKPIIPKEISGGAWTIRNGGGTDLLRGLRVYLLTDKVSSSAFVHRSRIAAPAWRKFADRLSGAAKNLKSPKTKAVCIKRSADLKSAATEVERVASLIAAEVSPEELVDTYKRTRFPADVFGLIESDYSSDADVLMNDSDITMKLLMRTEADGDMSSPVLNEEALSAIAASPAASTKCDIDGKYRFASAPESAKWVFAYFNSESLTIAWLLPVTDGSKVEIDLDNENAFLVQNKSSR